MRNYQWGSIFACFEIERAFLKGNDVFHGGVGVNAEGESRTCR